MNGINLRPYQEDATQAIIAACIATGRGLLILATGGGKTIVFSEIIKRTGVKTLILAHRQELLDQARTKILASMPDADIGIVSGMQKEWGHAITVASIQTATRNLARIESEGFRLVIVDEAHHATAKSYKTVLASLSDAWRIGVTATPDRLDKASIADMFGPVAYERDIIPLMQQGYLCDLQAVQVRSSVWLNNIGKLGGDYKADELAQAVNVAPRNLTIVKSYLEKASGIPAICFATSVEHACTLAQVFQLYGVRAVALDGTASQEERKKALDAYQRRETDVLVNCQLFAEGFDAPHTGCIIMARPTLSRALYCQMIGRGTRTSPGKERCIILDITDNTSKHKLQAVNLRKAIETPHVFDAPQDASILELLELAREQQAARERAQKDAEQRERERIERMQREQRERLLAEQKLTFTVVDIAGQHKQWRGTPKDGAYTMKVTSTTALHIQRCENGNYDVTEANSFLQKTCRIAKDVPLQEAQDAAEQHAQHVISLIQARVARTADEPATDKQRETMRRMRIGIPYECTKGQAQELIASRVQAQVARRA